jgi:hypothetical protein
LPSSLIHLEIRLPDVGGELAEFSDRGHGGPPPKKLTQCEPVHIGTSKNTVNFSRLEKLQARPQRLLLV